MSRNSRVVITFLLGCSIFLLIPALTWGIGSLETLLSNPVRLSFFVAVVVLNAFAAYRIPEVGKPREASSTSVPRQHVAANLLKYLSLAIVAVGPFCDRHDLWVLPEMDSVRWTGLALYVAGFLLMHFAEAQLGRQFSIEVEIKTQHALITGGLYRHIRHPRYTGIILFSLGLSLIFLSWAGIVFSGLTLLVLLWRIHDEEELMHKEFGPQWEDYCVHSKRLLPLVY